MSPQGSKQLSGSVILSSGSSALSMDGPAAQNTQIPHVLNLRPSTTSCHSYLYTWTGALPALHRVGQGLTSAFPKVYNVSKILWWSRYSIHGPVSPDSRSFSSWTSMSNIWSRWEGMFVSVTGALSSKQQKNHHQTLEKLLRLLVYNYIIQSLHPCSNSKLNRVLNHTPEVWSQCGCLC